MSATVITHPAGTARPLLSGGYAIDFGDSFPVIVPDRDHARDELDARHTTQTTATRRDRGREVGAVWEAAAPTSPQTN